MRLLLLTLALGLATVIPARAADDWVPEGGLRIKRSMPGTFSNSQFDQPSGTPGPPLSPYAQNLPGMHGQPATGGHSELGHAFSQPPTPAPGNNNSAAFTLDVSRFATPPADTPVLPISSGNVNAGTFIKRLVGKDLQILSSRDVIVLIDKSGSMGDKDCPPSTDGLSFPLRSGEPTQAVSRWEWCQQELISLSRNAAGALPRGFRVVLFSGTQFVYEHTNLNQISSIFQNNWPEGSTNAAAALQSQLSRYFSERASMGGRGRPAVIAVITDGLPNSATALKKTIIEASRAVRAPGEVAITFLQIGHDKKGMKLVHELDDNLLAQGAQMDIVDSKDFNELQQRGLGHALVDAINAAGRER